MRACADSLGVGRFGLLCAHLADRMWQGGNQWSGWPAYLSFFRHVARLPIDYSKWAHWETLARRSGPRVVHPEFCIVSDRPEVLRVDAQNRPHCEDGPFCRWRDGSALYSVHGVRVPAWIVEHPDRITVALIDAEQNTEVRRVMIARYGVEKFVRSGGAELVHEDVARDGTPRRLWRRPVPDGDPVVVVEVHNSTPEPDGSVRSYVNRVHPELRPLFADRLGEPQELTCHNAVASRSGLRGEEYAPEVET